MTRQGEADFHPRRYQVRHATTYAYDDDVVSCYERGFLRPRETATQELVSHDLVIRPQPDLVAEHVDHFGNRSSYVEVRTPHRRLEVVKTSVVDVAWPRVDLDALDAWTVGSAAEASARQPDRVEHVGYTLPSPLVGADPEVATYARRVLHAGRPLGQALLGLTTAIHEDFRFKRGATSVKTTLPDLLRLRAGVCQDFTHLALGCLRSFGLPARYVSGYLETTPPPGRPRLEGSDASHAWVSVRCPDGTWVDIDPTNAHTADSRYVVTAWGRDFRDVSPLKGVVFTEATTSTLDVAVDVVRLDGADGVTDSPADR
jgi:transglutaminase-like putative cysteine protease